MPWALVIGQRMKEEWHDQYTFKGGTFISDVIVRCFISTTHLC